MGSVGSNASVGETKAWDYSRTTGFDIGLMLVAEAEWSRSTLWEKTRQYSVPS